MSASRYRLVLDSANSLYTTTEYHATVDALIPGSFYSFTVTAIGSQGLESNNIVCINSTSEFETFVLNINYTIGKWCTLTPSSRRYYVRVSVRVRVIVRVRDSVTDWHCALFISLLIHLQVSDSSRNSKGVIPSKGVKWDLLRIGTNWRFSILRHRISQTVQDRTMIAKSHTCCRFDWYQNQRPWFPLNFHLKGLYAFRYITHKFLGIFHKNVN